MTWVLQESTLWTQVDPQPDPQTFLTVKNLRSFQGRGSDPYPLGGSMQMWE